ncbi:MAG: DNA-binding protein [Methylotenera sp.]|uniref:type II toxin-antitoxin system HipA family toxin YjjJ n=1 Tax=Methylotenera sp. TaxID=2051956 RepID=UPI000D42486A|nr:type II toxin-antitoxin system HipA family toxin YjjJ [Methylotenera sp.]PPC84870.1 MAG: DNA-binding protein [Methylotenera sp.]PPD02230.1 MAG: DNA-binding protein [Methylotenera sp.]
MNNSLIATLMRLGPSSSEAIGRQLNVSQPTISRMLSVSANQVIRIGGSKNTIYAVPRKIRQLKDAIIPVFKVDELGVVTRFGELISVYPEGFLWEANQENWPAETPKKRYFNSLPYFIHNSSPQGFMGRNFARINCDALGVPEDLNRWSDDDALVAMAILGEDVPGNLILGETSYRRFTEQNHDIIKESELADSYLALAKMALSNGVAGSSAGGEFPKFTAIRENQNYPEGVAHVIVKFSGTGDTAHEQRWADLLRCEAYASEITNTHLNAMSAASAVITHGGRTFMESTRFDRVGMGGRRSMCSLSSLDAELVGSGDMNWEKLAEQLFKLKLIDENTAQTIRRVFYFGKLIGNSDMHNGNLSFGLSESGKLVLSPIYDMLPMRYAPQRGVELPELIQDSLYKPMPGYEDDYVLALKAALAFWVRVSLDSDVSSDFRDIAEKWVVQLENLGIYKGNKVRF